MVTLEDADSELRDVVSQSVEASTCSFWLASLC